MEQQRFYVSHLWPAAITGKAYMVELLDQFGRTKALGFVDDDEDFLRISNLDVPRKVIEAARRQERGTSDFVDSDGKQVFPKNPKFFVGHLSPCDPDNVGGKSTKWN